MLSLLVAPGDHFQKHLLFSPIKYGDLKLKMTKSSNDNLEDDEVLWIKIIMFRSKILRLYETTSNQSVYDVYDEGCNKGRINQMAKYELLL